MLTVKIYSTNNCYYCNQAKEYFDNNGIAFENINVQTDLEARAHMKEISGQMGVPVIEFNGKVMVGWDEDRFKELVK